MKVLMLLVSATLLAICGTSSVMAQLSPSVVAMEKERLRKANEKPQAVQLTADDVAAASAMRKSNPALAYETDCAAKLAAGCFDLGNHLRNKNGRTPEDAIGETTAYGRACELNHAEGCYKLGEMKEKGLRTTRDPMLALNAYGRSCKLGFSNGCYNAATLLSSGKSAEPALQAKQALAAQSLYKAGCDLKHYYSCKAIGLTLPEPAASFAAGPTKQQADAAYQASQNAAPTFRPSQIRPSDTGYMKWGVGPMAEMTDKIDRERDSKRIDAAVAEFERKIAREGYAMTTKSYVLQRLNKHKISMNAGEDYMIFAACNEYCKNVTASLEFIAESGGLGYKTDDQRDAVALSRSFVFTPKLTAIYPISVRSFCLDDPCTNGSAAQLVVFRRTKKFDIEAVPPRP